jgi:hypothetical protein
MEGWQLAGVIKTVFAEAEGGENVKNLIRGSGSGSIGENRGVDTSSCFPKYYEG